MLSIEHVIIVCYHEDPMSRLTLPPPPQMLLTGALPRFYAHQKAAGRSDIWRLLPPASL